MATYASLSAEQKARLTEHATLLRPLMGELARMLNHADAMNALYNSEASAILATLDAGEDIPNPTGLPGAAPLTQAETITLVSYGQNLLTSYNTDAHRQNYSRAAGGVALVG